MVEWKEVGEVASEIAKATAILGITGGGFAVALWVIKMIASLLGAA